MVLYVKVEWHGGEGGGGGVKILRIWNEITCLYSIGISNVTDSHNRLFLLSLSAKWSVFFVTIPLALVKQN